ncbi:MAG: hypothetical protein IIC62_03375 [Proteobacteria bacterium]|nr:hypothetical protein [Pseudomonadota bacterium]
MPSAVNAAAQSHVAAAALSDLGLLNTQTEPGALTLLATDGATRFARVGGQFLGEDLSPDDIRIVDL